MKNYDLKDFNTFEDLMNSMAEELNAELISTKVQSNKFGEGSIVSVTGCVTDKSCGFSAYIEYPGIVKQMSLNVALSAGSIQMAEDKIKILNEYSAVLQVAKDEKDRLENEKREAVRKAKEDAIEAEKQRIKKIRAEENFEKRKVSTLAKLDELPKNKVVVDNSLYSAIGWIANNMTSISAAMPDFCESWFRKQFGDVKARVVDQSKKSPSGWVSQWGLSLTINLKTSAKENIPYILKQYTDRNKSAQIADTQFVFTLLEDYGFKIGSAKEQDLDEIMSRIPADGLAEFELGLAA